MNRFIASADDIMKPIAKHTNITPNIIDQKPQTQNFFFSFWTTRHHESLELGISTGSKFTLWG